jgi:hypothetical protein
MTKQTIEWKRGRAYTADATLLVEPGSRSGGYVWAVLRDGHATDSGHAETETAEQAAQQAVESADGPLNFQQLDDQTLEALFCALLVFCDDIHSNPEEAVWTRADELRTLAVTEMDRRNGYATRSAGD